MEDDSGPSGLPAALAIVSADPQALQVAVQLEVADRDAARAFLDVDERYVRHRPLGQVELLDIAEWPAGAWFETSVAEAGRAAQFCPLALDPDWTIATGQVDDVRGGE